MSEFARVLSTIIEQGKELKRFSIKELAQHAQITPSYLSNLKQSNRRPPARKTLLKLTEALRQLGVSEAEVQQLIDAYNRQDLNAQEEGKLLESLIDEYKEDGTLFARVKQGVQMKGLVLKEHSSQPQTVETEALAPEILEGDHHAFLARALRLLEKSQEIVEQGGRIYVTWFHHDLQNKEFNRDRKDLRNMLRRFLWADSPFQVFHLWAGEIAREMTVIVDFLVSYIGTSHCFLYEVPHGEHLPEYLVVEHVGFIEAKPIADNHYWIRSVIAENEHSPQAAELQALIQYLEYLLGPPGVRKPLVKTNVPAARFSITPVTRKLADMEKQNIKSELLLIKTSLSARFRPVENARALLEASHIPEDRIEAYVNHHLERVTTQEKRLESGRGRSIHEKEFLKKEFHDVLPSMASAASGQEATPALEARMLRGQIRGVLHTLRQNPNIHFAFADQEFLIRFSLSGNTAFLSFDPPRAQGELPLTRDDMLVRAWTEHPDVVYQLRQEFNAIWKGIDPQWRTDNEPGRQNVINFLIKEPLKAVLNADVPGAELWAFVRELLDEATYLDGEAFTREIYTYEQVAKDIFMLSNNLPLTTMPTDVGPWDSRSALRTRQILFHALLQDIERVHLVVSQQRCEEYWKTGAYKTYTFNREWITRHLHYLHDLLVKFPDKLTLDLISQPAPFPINLEVINWEYVFFRNTDATEQEGGVVLHDRELAEALRTYVDRNFLSNAKQRKESHDVITWFEEHFGIV